MDKGILKALLSVLLFVLPAFAMDKVGTTTVTSGQIPTPTEWNTYLNRAENWINAILLNGGNQLTIAGGDSMLVNGTAVIDTARITGHLDQGANIIWRLDDTYTLGRPSRRALAIHTDSIVAVAGAFTTSLTSSGAGATTALGTTTVANSFTVNSGAALNLNSLADSSDIKDGTVSRADLRADAVDSVVIRAASVAGSDLAPVLTANLAFRGSHTVLSGADTVHSIDAQGHVTARKTASFLVRLASAVLNQTGNNTSYTIAWDTEVFDQGANFSSTTFTAPVTGRYQFNLAPYFTGVTANQTSIQVYLNTSNRNICIFYREQLVCDLSALIIPCSMLMDMDANDTATASVTCTGSSGGDVVDIGAGAYYSGFLAH